MLADQELALLYTLARDYATGEGAIVDAGCFLGGSSAALLAGVRDRPSPWSGPPVVSYDLFQVEEYTLAEYFADVPGLKVGDSFRPLYDRNVAGYGVPHTVMEGDIAAHGWTGGPIEVLFLDVLKSPAVNDAILRGFLPHVIPGRTVIVHQDYEWGHVPWLHITVELMRDSLRWIDAVPHCTHLFLVERPIPADLLTTSVWHDLGDARKLELMEQAIDRNSGDARGMVELSKVVLLALLGRVSEAAALLDSVDRRYESQSVSECAELIRGNVDALQARERASSEASPESLPPAPKRGPQPSADPVARLSGVGEAVPELDPEASEEADESDAAAIAALVRRYAEALGAGDASAACGDLSSELQRQMAEQGDDREGCQELLSHALARIAPARRAAIAALEVIDVRRQADCAFAVCSIPGVGKRALPARRDHGEWKLVAIFGSPVG